jgi:hypothetical protein
MRAATNVTERVANLRTASVHVLDSTLGKRDRIRAVLIL